jgi:hypothetical protein
LQFQSIIILKRIHVLELLARGNLDFDSLEVEHEPEVGLGHALPFRFALLELPSELPIFIPK